MQENAAFHFKAQQQVQKLVGSQISCFSGVEYIGIYVKTG